MAKAVHWAKIGIGDHVTHEQAEELKRENAELRLEIQKLERLLRRDRDQERVARPPAEKPKTRIREEHITSQRPLPAQDNGFADDFEEGLYLRLLARILREPEIIRLKVAKPRIDLEIEMPTITIDGASLKGRIAGLLAKGFFDGPCRNAEVKRELERTGGGVANSNLSNALHDFVKLGFLTDEEKLGFQSVPGMLVNVLKR